MSVGGRRRAEKLSCLETSPEIIQALYLTACQNLPGLKNTASGA